MCAFVFLRQELWLRSQILQEEDIKSAQAATVACSHEDTQDKSGQKEEEEKDIKSRPEERKKAKDLERNTEKRSDKRRNNKRVKAATTIQTNWRKHRNRVGDTRFLSKIWY